MSKHPAAALQRAVYAALAGSPALSAALGGAVDSPPRIFDQVPDPIPAFPYVTIGEDQIIDDGNTCSEFATECFATVHVWTRDEFGLIAAKIIGALVEDALNVDLVIDGQIMSDARLESARYSRASDGQTSHGVLTFRYLLDPEA